MPFSPVRLYQIIRNAYFDLSIDVAVGAVCCQLMVAHLEKITLPIHLPISLFFTVLLIYWVDHWQDARKIKNIITSRHSFFLEYQKQMKFFIISLFFGLVLFSLIFLSWSELVFGTILACSSGLYLILVKISGEKKWIFFQKEVCIALIFTVAIWGSVWQKMQLIPIKHVLQAVIFALIAFQNLLLFGYYEFEGDVMQRQRSIATMFGKDFTKKILHIVCILALFFCVLGWGYSESKLSMIVVVIEMIMSLILTLLFYNSAWSLKKNRYRYIGDAVFLIPVFVLIF
jgi:4-hydroxybenzoate polyprenyltransferase